MVVLLRPRASAVLCLLLDVFHTADTKMELQLQKITGFGLMHCSRVQMEWLRIGLLAP
jgi:hypothetical protein